MTTAHDHRGPHIALECSLPLGECNLTFWIMLSRIGFRLSDWCNDAGGSVKPCKERLETMIGQ